MQCYGMSAVGIGCADALFLSVLFSGVILTLVSFASLKMLATKRALNMSILAVSLILALRGVVWVPINSIWKCLLVVAISLLSYGGAYVIFNYWKAPMRYKTVVALTVVVLTVLCITPLIREWTILLLPEL